MTGATRATYVAFVFAGFGFASWASRIPAIRDEFALSSGQLGLVLLAGAMGSVLSLPLAGPVVHRLGGQRTVGTGSLVLATGLVIAAVGQVTSVVVVGAGLFVVGLANGAWDVAMNVQAATVERTLGWAIMPRFHAGFSVGTVAGALLAALLVGLDVPVAWHFVGVAVVVAAVVPTAARGFLPDVEEHEEQPSGTTARAWREPRTLAIGVFVLAFAFTEGTGNDWIAVASIDGYDVPKVVGTLGFACFLIAMTLGRWVGPHVLDRHGRVALLRALTLLAIAGLLLFVFGGHPALGFAGVLLWGLGASLGFPVGMTAAADDPAYAAVRVSVVASIGYCAFLAGPPLIGFLGSNDTVRHALLVVVVALGVAAALAGNLASPAETSLTTGRGRTPSAE